MKKLVGYEHDFGGGDVKGKASAQVAIDATDIVMEIAATGRVPVEKIAKPAFDVIDNLVDKIEQWIPGDQKAMAAELKKDARELLLKLIAEQSK